MNRLTLIIVTAITMLTLAGCGDSSNLIKNSKKRNAVERKFKQRTAALLHNRQTQLLDVLNNATQQEKEALKFLYAYVPLSDLSNYDGNYYLGQVQYALKARDTFSWGKLVSEDDFLHFVLPPRTGTENLDTARQVIFNELLPRLSGMTMKEAALEINHWCHEKVVYTSTDDRTSAPLATMKTAFGRCGEESVFTVAALRAVGIPARQIYTPRWAHQDDNHAWVEFWADGEWYFYGACEPEPDVNIAWFTEPARRSMLTSTTTPGYYNTKHIINREENFTRLNQVDNYTEAKDLFVKVLDENGKPAEDATVRYLVYNYAEFYSLADLKTDKNGFSSLRLGLGDVTVWASMDNNFAFKKVSVAITDTVTLTIGTTKMSDYELEMNIVRPVAKTPLPVSEEARAENNIRLAKEDSIRHAYEKTFMSRNEAIDFATKHDIDPESFASIIKKSRGNWAEICRVVEMSSGNPWVVSLLLAITEKDLRDAKSDILISHLKHTVAFKSDWDEDIWVNYVLSPRIALENMTAFKEELRKIIGDDVFTQVATNPLYAAGWIDKNIKPVGDSENYIWVPAVPRGVVEMKAADKYSRDILFVAMCRTAGVPARVNPVTGDAEYMEALLWKPAFVKQDEELKEKTAKISFDYAGKEKCKYSVHFSLARFENGFFRTLTFDYGKDVKDLPSSIDVEPGYYMLVTGNRLNDGSVLAKITFKNIEAGNSYKLPVEIREEENALESLGQIKMPDFLTKDDGSKTEVGQLIKTYGAAALIWLDPGKEPTRHVLKDLREMKQLFDDSNLPFLFFVPKEKQTASFDYSSLELPNNADFAQDTDMLNQLSKVFNRKFAASLPVIVMVNAQGEVLYLSSGYKIGSCDQLLKSYHQLRHLPAPEAETCRVP